MYPDYLVHFNPNHDPKTGQFAPGAGGSTVNKVGARLKKADLLNVDGPNAWRDFKNKTGNYLCHYNKNHSPKNGQFTSGDGDGDGISNDHAHRSKKDGGRKPITRSQAKAQNDAYRLAIARAKTEDMNRRLTRGVSKGTKILVPKGTKEEFGKLINEMDRIWKEVENNWDDVYCRILTENGKEYISVTIADKSLGDYYPQQLIELHEQK